MFKLCCASIEFISYLSWIHFTFRSRARSAGQKSAHIRDPIERQNWISIRDWIKFMLLVQVCNQRLTAGEARRAFFGQRFFLKVLLKSQWLLFHPVVFDVVCKSCDVESDTNMKRAPSSQTNEVRAKRNLESWDDAWDRCFPEGLCQVGNVI